MKKISLYRLAYYALLSSLPSVSLCGLVCVFAVAVEVEILKVFAQQLVVFVKESCMEVSR